MLELLEGEMDSGNPIYQILQQTQTSYTNHSRIKLIFFNLIHFLQNLYPREYFKHIAIYTREEYVPAKKQADFGQNLIDII